MWLTRTVAWLGCSTRSGQRDAALAEYREAIRLHEERLVRVPDPTYGEGERAAAYFEYALLLSQVGRVAEARAHYEKGLAIQPKTAVDCNNLAWLLATAPDPSPAQPGPCCRAGAKSVELRPEESVRTGTPWARPTTGRATGRPRSPPGEVDGTARKAATAFDWFFLAMAHWQLGEKDKAREWYDQAVQWMDKNQPTE